MYDNVANMSRGNGDRGKPFAFQTALPAIVMAAILGAQRSTISYILLAKSCVVRGLMRYKVVSVFSAFVTLLAATDTVAKAQAAQETPTAIKSAAPLSPRNTHMTSSVPSESFPACSFLYILERWTDAERPCSNTYLAPILSHNLKEIKIRLVTLSANCPSATYLWCGGTKREIANLLYKLARYDDALQYITEDIRDVEANNALSNRSPDWLRKQLHAGTIAGKVIVGFDHCERARIDYALADTTGARQEFATCFDEVQTDTKELGNSLDKDDRAVLTDAVAQAARFHLSRAAVMFALGDIQEAAHDAVEFTGYVPADPQPWLYRGEAQEFAGAIRAKVTNIPFHSAWHEAFETARTGVLAETEESVISTALKSALERSGFNIDGIGEHGIKSRVSADITDVTARTCRLAFTFHWNDERAGQLTSSRTDLAISIEKVRTLPSSVNHLDLAGGFKIVSSVGGRDSWALDIGDHGSIEIFAKNGSGPEFLNGTMLVFSDFDLAEHARRTFLAAVAKCIPSEPADSPSVIPK